MSPEQLASSSSLRKSLRFLKNTPIYIFIPKASFRK